MRTVGERLSAERLAWKLSQEELARRAGVKRQSNISNLETGTRKRGAHIPRLAAALNLNALWLLEECGPKYADEGLARRMGFLPPLAGQDSAPYTTPQMVERPTHLIPVLGIMIGAYIFTRMLNTALREDTGVIVSLFCLLTMLVDVVGMLILLASGLSILGPSTNLMLRP